VRERGRPIPIDVVAHHAAGHAVVAAIGGCKLVHVAIVPGHLVCGQGRVDYAVPAQRPGGLLGWRSAVAARTFDLWVSLLVGRAGRAAEARFRELPVGLLEDDGRCADMRAAVRAALELTGGDRPLAATYLFAAEREAERLVERNWRVVQAFARQLIAQQEIDGREAHRLVARAIRELSLTPVFTAYRSPVIPPSKDRTRCGHAGRPHGAMTRADLKILPTYPPNA